MATINVNIGKNDVLNINVVGASKNNNEDINALHNKLKEMLNAYNSKRYKEEHKHWWYEVFIDFSEDFDEFIYPKIKDMEFEEQYTFCLGYMYRRDEYYFSPQYYNNMNEMLRDAKFE